MKPFALAILPAILAPLWAGVAVQADAAAQSSCDGVWVVVDYGTLGGTDTACATSYSTGAAALRSAGFNPEIPGGFVEKIGGKPSRPDKTKYYWSYWQATLNDDGSYSGWSYSNLGATASHPKKGNAEGWRYLSLSEGKAAPSARPPAGTPGTPSPTPSRSSKPSARPSAKSTATRTATASASATKTVTAAVRATPTAAPASATPTAEGTPASSPATAAPLATEVAQQQVSATPDPGSGGGSPVGAIAAGAAAVVAGTGLGGWWFLKGRKR